MSEGTVKPMRIPEKVKIIIDRPLGRAHPNHPDIVYPVNYGYIPGVTGGDGEEQDVYLLGVNEPAAEYEAVLIAVIHRLDDVEDKWVAAPEGVAFTKAEIMNAVHFQEQYFKTEITMIKQTGSD